MAYGSFDNRLSSPAGLVCAAIVATSVTTWLVLLAAGLADAWFAGADASRAFWGSLLTDLVLTPVVAIAFGFIGAAIFLAVAFLIVRGRSRQAHWIAGAAAGATHSLAGILSWPAAERFPKSDLLDTVLIWGGFLLTGGPRDIVEIAVWPASIIAGAVAGMVFARVTGVPKQLPVGEMGA